MPSTVIDNTLVVDFTFERETKNTVRFAEDVAEDSTAVIGTLYIQKEALEAAGVEPAEGTKVTATFTLA